MHLKFNPIRLLFWVETRCNIHISPGRYHLEHHATIHQAGASEKNPRKPINAIGRTSSTGLVARVILGIIINNSTKEKGKNIRGKHRNATLGCKIKIFFGAPQD